MGAFKLLKGLAMAGTLFEKTSRWTRFKINAGIFIKHIRQIVEDVYSDFEVLDEKN